MPNKPAGPPVFTRYVRNARHWLMPQEYRRKNVLGDTLHGAGSTRAGSYQDVGLYLQK
jgi:hypothetical protein